MARGASPDVRHSAYPAASVEAAKSAIHTENKEPDVRAWPLRIGPTAPPTFTASTSSMNDAVLAC